MSRAGGWAIAAWIVALGACRGAGDAPPGESPTAAMTTTAMTTTMTTTATTTTATSASAEPVVRAMPPLVDASGHPLAQTDTAPSLDSPSYKARVALLWRAIVDDAPQLAIDSFFPVIAYEQVKAIPNPPADWSARLIKAFTRDVHAYHAKLGADPSKATFVSLDVPTATSRWMKPGSEGNKLGYYRVLKSTLRFRRGDGSDGALDVTSMISWRGEWFVVHLAGFK
ncbi:MAG: hypothetical protein ACHREM_17025 [Polyangiales bacterium]